MSFLYTGPSLTVAQLIEHLQTLPQDLPVSGYCADESTGWVTLKGIRIETEDREEWNDLYNEDGTPFIGQHLDIMGF